MTNNKIKLLKDNGEAFYPITSVKAVLTESGEPLDEVVSGLNGLEANPTIPDGITPTDLTALKVGAEYYAPASSGGGGSQLYKHYITMYENMGSNITRTVYLTLINNSVAATTYADIVSILQKVNILGITGYMTQSRTEVYTLNSLEYFTDTRSYVYFVKTDGTANTNAFITNACTITDRILDMSDTTL